MVFWSYPRLPAKIGKQIAESDVPFINELDIYDVAVPGNVVPGLGYLRNRNELASKENVDMEVPARARIRNLNDIIAVLNARIKAIPQLGEGFPEPLDMPSRNLAVRNILQGQSEEIDLIPACDVLFERPIMIAVPLSPTGSACPILAGQFHSKRIPTMRTIERPYRMIWIVIGMRIHWSGGGCPKLRKVPLYLIP